MLKAISLLRDTEAKIIDVAEQCGFNHLGLFNTCFKRRFGTSPGQWRKSPVKTPKAPASQAAKKPVCPLQATGSCPLAGGKHGAVRPAVVTTIAGKIKDGTNILDELDRRDLMFGAQSMSNNKRNSPEPRADE